MTLLLKLFAVYDLLKNPTALFECGYLNPTQLSMLKVSYRELLLKVKDQALNLIEAFDYEDNLVNSCIGNSYGDIYE